MANAHEGAPDDITQAEVQGFSQRLVEFRASLTQTQGALMDGLLMQSEAMFAPEEGPEGATEVEGHASLYTILRVAAKCAPYSYCFYQCWYRYGNTYISWCGDSCARRYPCWATREAGLG